jgi:membrane fusion protein
VAQVEQLKRGISNAGQELVESESKRNFDIVSPISGTLVAAYLESGQAVDPSRSVASIVPEGAELVAQIYAPSKSVGLLKTGGRALIRYHSFPFEVFGTAHGTIKSISRVALSSSDFNAVGGYAGDPSNQGEPIYKVTIAIDKQHVMVDGERIELRAGMLLDADLVLETRHIYQWILAPIYRALSSH